MGRDEYVQQANYSTLLGSRYVFFSELQSTNSSLYKNVQAHFSHILDKASSKNKEEIEEQAFFSLIDDVAIQLQEVTNNYRTIEEDFLIRHKEQIKEYRAQLRKENENNPILVYIDKLVQILNKNKINSFELIAAFNFLRNNLETYNKKINEMYGFLKAQQQENKVAPTDLITLTKKDNQEIEKTLLDWLLEDGYTNYREALLKKNFKPLENSLAQIQTKRIMNFLKKIPEDDDFLTKIRGRFGANTDPTVIANFILNLVSDKVSQNLNKTSDDFINEIEEELGNGKFQFDLPDMSKIFSRAKDTVLRTSFEKLAMSKAGKLADFVLNLSKEERKNFLNESIYKDYIPKSTKDTLLDVGREFTSTGRGNITRSLQNAFFQAINDQVMAIPDDVKNGKGKLTDVQMKTLYNELKKNNIKLLIPSDAVRKNLSVEVKASDVAEILSNLKSNTILEQLGDAITSYAPGKSVNFKDDIVGTVNITYLPLAYYRFNEIVDFDEYSKNFMKTFVNEYHSKTTETNVKVAAEIYENHVKDLKKKYTSAMETLAINGEDINELKTYFENIFLNEISVKEYEFIHNDIGFKGGSLGGSFSAIAGINTIYDMYELGGISTLDKDLLIEAVLNSGVDTVLTETNGNVIESIKKFLLGGAILSMFDAGFSQTKKYLDKMKAKYKVVPKTLELYQFGSLYVPASIVLQTVVNGLKELKEETTKITDKTKFSSTIEFSGQVNSTILETLDKNASPMERWNEVSEYAQSNTKMYVLLAAGLLDLFENLEKYFNPEKI